MTTRTIPCLLVCAALSFAGAARADGPDDTLRRARSEFISATDFVKNARWGEALAAFERSANLHAHSLTTYNIGACERALGRYTRARATLHRAIDQNVSAGGRELPSSFAEDAKTWLTEIEGLLVRASVTIDPPDASLLVDGVAPTAESADVYIAGLPPRTTAAASAPPSRFTLLMDPGVHIFSVEKAGFNAAAINRTFAPHATPELPIDLTKQPALLRISANRADATVAVDGIDVGVVPVQITRPAGAYNIFVRKAGFVAYQTTLDVRAGEQSSLRAVLAEQTTPLYKKAWFWGAAGVVVAGATALTYFLVRPDPQRPAADGGGLGWVVQVPTR